jgi:hypothetical protein
MEQLAQSDSNVTLSGAIFLALMAILTCCLPRRQAVLPLLVTICYMPLGQRVVVGGLHFMFFRILLLVAWCRVLARRETENLRFTILDKLFLWWAIVTLVLGTLANPTLETLINRGGTVYNAVGAYFLIRFWVRNTDDVATMVCFLGVMILPLALSMIVEKFTRHNVFSVFGGVPEITEEREGRLRCQGAFRHPILAGTYAATLFPLFVGLWSMGGRKKWRAITGACSTVVVTMAAVSSGALLALIAAVIGLAAWRAREHMRQMRWGIVFVVIALSLVMKAPVWYLIARVSEIAGGSGWHRSYLIDQAVKHFDEWWLVGSTYTAHWAPAGQVLAVDPNNMDITNHYIAEGLGGGVLKLGLFLAMIVVGFKTVGRWIHRQELPPLCSRIFLWSIGVCLFAHCVSFISISYFDQLVSMWYWLLAIISMLAAELQVREQPAAVAEAAANALEQDLPASEEL